MAESIYFYINEFPIIELKIEQKGNATNGTINNQCNELKSTLSGYLKDNGDKFSTKCGKIAQYQGQIISETNSTEPALCNYINYWFYDILETEKQSSHYTLLEQFYEKVTSLKACDTHKRKISGDKYKELKYLHALYTYFKLFKDESSIKDNKNCKHGKKCVDMYNKTLKNCQDDHNNDLCKKLIKFKYEYDKHIEKMIGCRDKIEYLKPIKNDLASIISFSFVLMTSITFILLLLYKYTPVGSWLRARLPGGKNKTNKLDKRIQELQNTSELDGRRYKLPYQS